MRTALSFLSLTIFFTVPAFADDKPPFTWPKSYCITEKTTGYNDSFVNTYCRSGQKARNFTVRDDLTTELSIFHVDGNALFLIEPEGMVKELPLPNEWLMSDPFRTDGTWELLGNDAVDNIPAVKYKVSNPSWKKSPEDAMPYFTLWLTADNKTPLKREFDATYIGGEAGTVVTEYSYYFPGPVADTMFEVPDKK